MPEFSKQELLRKAAARLGLTNLAILLQVPTPLIQAWIDGHASMPDRKLLQLADVLDRIAGDTQQ